MKKLIYIFAILCIPATVFCQAQNAYYQEDTKFTRRIVQISPNPGNGQFVVAFDKNHDIYTSMIVFDATGKVVFEQQHINGTPLYVDLTKFQPGIYFAQFMANNRMEKLTERIIIAR